MERELAYDISVCVHRADLAVEPVSPWDGTSLAAVVLRRIEGAGVASAHGCSSPRSFIAAIPAGWSAVAVRADGAVVQLFVLSGQLRVGDVVLGEHGFAMLPGAISAAGSPLVIEALTACEAIIIVDAPRDGAELLAPVLIADCHAIEPFVPVIAGKRLEGFERRVLWLDPRTGSDTRMLKVPGGFGGVGGANYHPVEEEIYCIAGDIQPDDSRPMRAGSYLWNPAWSIHGFAEKTVGGCLLLEWHDGPWDLTRVPDADR